jgi:hypothetical protein
METTAGVLGSEDAQPIRLDPGAWWGLVAAAVLVLTVLVGPILVLAMGDDLDHEVQNVPGAAVSELTQASPTTSQPGTSLAGP